MPWRVIWHNCLSYTFKCFFETYLIIPRLVDHLLCPINVNLYALGITFHAVKMGYCVTVWELSSAIETTPGCPNSVFFLPVKSSSGVGFFFILDSWIHHSQNGCVSASVGVRWLFTTQVREYLSGCVKRKLVLRGKELCSVEKNYIFWKYTSIILRSHGLRMNL